MLLPNDTQNALQCFSCLRHGCHSSQKARGHGKMRLPLACRLYYRQAHQKEISIVDLQIGDKVITNSGRLGKISYPSNQLVRLQPTRSESLQLADGDHGNHGR
jgi:hypothetical protein